MPYAPSKRGSELVGKDAEPGRPARLTHYLVDCLRETLNVAAGNAGDRYSAVLRGIHRMLFRSD